jgi:hypothetical protein
MPDQSSKQMIKHYSVIAISANVMKKFENDAIKLAHEGWRVQTVTETRHGRNWLGQQKVMALTVVYARD